MPRKARPVEKKRRWAISVRDLTRWWSNQQRLWGKRLDRWGANRHFKLRTLKGLIKAEAFGTTGENNQGITRLQVAYLAVLLFNITDWMTNGVSWPTLIVFGVVGWFISPQLREAVRNRGLGAAGMSKPKTLYLTEAPPKRKLCGKSVTVILPDQGSTRPSTILPSFGIAITAVQRFIRR